jgi:two-component system NtrC family sensor kinase
MKNLEHLMLDCSPTMMLLVEAAGLCIVVANEAAQKTLGYSEAQLLGMKITGIESSLQDVFYWEDVSNGVLLEIESQEGLYQCANDAMLTVMKSIRVLSHDGRTLLLVQARGVQDERAMEDTLAHTLSQLQATLESTGNGILVVDWHGSIASMNKLFSAMWRLPDELLIERDDAQIVDFIVRQVLESELCRTRLQEVVGSDETEDLFHLKDGRVLECQSRPQFLGERIIGRVFGFSDITERKVAEAALRESRDLLEQRVQERTAKLEQAQSQLLQSEKMATIGQLAAGVAHEINNPVAFVSANLGALQHYVEDLLKLLAAYEQAEASLAAPELAGIAALKAQIDPAFLREDIGCLLAESMDGVKRVKNIVQDLRDFSHVDESERQWADLEAGMDSTLRVVSNELKYKASVVKEYAGIPQIECYASQLNQVFVNLLVNASHAMDEGGTITVRTGRDADMVWVEVEDTGKGIAPEHLGRIFDPFFTTKPVGKGTGLGLSLAYGIVQKHNGRIDVWSVVGQGTRFRINLPAGGTQPAT